MSDFYVLFCFLHHLILVFFHRKWGKKSESASRLTEVKMFPLFADPFCLFGLNNKLHISNIFRYRKVVEMVSESQSATKIFSFQVKFT